MVSLEWFKKKLKELYIRFNTSPKEYLKKDYYILLQLLGGLIENSESDGGNIDIKTTGIGNVVTDINKDENTLIITKGLARYPRARWARRGFIDLTNCKDIDYIIVPCTTKQLCLYVTNSYLKSLRHIETYESIYGLELEYDENENPIIPEDFFKTVSQYFDHDSAFISGTTTYNLPRILTNLQEDLLPSTTKSEHYINCKEFCVLKKVYNSQDPLKVLFNRKDVHDGFIQFPYFPESNISLKTLKSTKFIFTPYQVFANPFNSTLGGVIPVKDGKLLIEKATRLKNKTLELVSTGELIRFDEYGICDTQFNPETFVYTTRKVAKKGKSNGRHCDRKVIIHNAAYSPRRGSANVRRNIRMTSGMMVCKRTWLPSLVGWRVTKWKKLFPCVVNKANYKKGKILDYLTCTWKNKIISLAAFDKISDWGKYFRVGYAEFKTDNSMLSRALKYFKAPYDRMNTYTINKYSLFTKVFLRLSDQDKYCLYESKYSV